MKGFVVRVNGIELHIVFGRNITLLGYMHSDDGEHCLGLGWMSVHAKRLKKREGPSLVKTHGPSKGKCFICGELMLDGEAVEAFEPLPIPVFSREVQVHSECLVFARHGRVGCQRGLCPDCAAPAGQSIRDQARDAEAFFKASNGRRPKGGVIS